MAYYDDENYHHCRDPESDEEICSDDCACGGSDFDGFLSSEEERQNNKFTILKESDIKQRLEDDINTLAADLRISDSSATILLILNHWIIPKARNSWLFPTDDRVLKALGLPLTNTLSSSSSSSSSTEEDDDDEDNDEDEEDDDEDDEDDDEEEEVEEPLNLTYNNISCHNCCQKSTSVRSDYCRKNHYYCASCWQGYISRSINKDGPGVLSLECPYPSCSAAVTRNMIHLLASREDMERYERYLVWSYVEDNENIKIKWCPFPPCECAVVFDDQGSESGSGSAKKKNCDVSCLCSYKFCWNCKQEAHSPVDCETAAKWILKNNSEFRCNMINYFVSPFSWRPCPKCNRPIGKDHGSMHMTCTPPCEFQFCWLCNDDWKHHDYKACNEYKGYNNDNNNNNNASNRSTTKWNSNFGTDDAKDERQRRGRLMTKMSEEKYTHYYMRWAKHQCSRQHALLDMNAQLNSVAKYLPEEPRFKFFTKAWLLIVECRRVLAWTYAYGYYLTDEEHHKKMQFELYQGITEAGLERLHQFADKLGMMDILRADESIECPKDHFSCSQLTRLIIDTRENFEALVRGIENGFED